MSRYVDGFVIPIKKKKMASYKKLATVGRKIWMEHGALDYYECVGANLKSQMGGIAFTDLCKLKNDETVVFAFIVYKSKAHRDKVTKKVHNDPRMQPENFDGEMPFDMKRFTVGEFTTLVHS